MKRFIDLIHWLFRDETVYVRICNTCGFIHYDKSESCCLCLNPTIKVSESRAKSWKQELKINRAVKSVNGVA